MDNITKLRSCISDAKGWAIPNIRNFVTSEEWQQVSSHITQLERTLDALKAANEPIYTHKNPNELTEIIGDLEG